MTMASEYDPDDELAQWTGGYFNGEGSFDVGAQNSTSTDTGYEFKVGTTVGATVPEIAGLVDGEGGFSIGAGKKDSVDIGYSFGPDLRVSMTTKPDIYRYAQWLKQNDIDYGTYSYHSDKENREEMLEVATTSAKSLEQVIDSIFPYLSLIKRLQAYIVKTEFLPRYNSGVHRTERGYLETMSWIELQREYKGNHNSNDKHTFRKFNNEVWPEIEPRDSHMAPSKKEFEKQLFGDKERETFEEKTGPSPRQPDKDWDGEDDPFEI